MWRNSCGDERGTLQRVPSSREDVFADERMSMKAKRSLMKFLRHLQSQQGQQEEASQDGFDKPLPEFLQSKLQVPMELHDPLMALSLTPKTLDQTAASYAIPRIRRHLESLGLYGPGFASMLMKWGGGAELSQVACRACAVGGGVYVLKRGIEDMELPEEPTNDLRIELSDGEKVQSKFVVGSPWDLPSKYVKQASSTTTKLSRAAMIVSSPLEPLFPVTSEGGPASAGTVVVFPGTANNPPVYLLVHSSDTGECPTGQCEYTSFQTSILFCTLPDDSTIKYLSTLSAITLKIKINSLIREQTFYLILVTISLDIG